MYTIIKEDIPRNFSKSTEKAKSTHKIVRKYGKTMKISLKIFPFCVII